MFAMRGLSTERLEAEGMRLRGCVWFWEFAPLQFQERGGFSGAYFHNPSH